MADQLPESRRRCQVIKEITLTGLLQSAATAPLPVLALFRAIILQHVSSVPSRSYRSARVDRLHQTTRAPVGFRHNARQLRKLSCQVFAPISQHLPAFFLPKSADPSSPRP